jgi:hypothetical protein
MNIFLDKKCYIVTRDNLYLAYSPDKNGFYLNDDIIDSSCLFYTYSLEETSSFCNKVSYIKHSLSDIYLSHIPSPSPEPILIAYDHCSERCLEDPLYHEKKWKYENRILHNITGEALCYKEGCFYFQYRNYYWSIDNTPYLSYVELLYN